MIPTILPNQVYPFMAFISVHDHETVIANLAWATIGPEGESELRTFQVNYSENGNAPATHSVIGTVLDHNLYQSLLSMINYEFQTAHVLVLDFENREVIFHHNTSIPLGSVASVDDFLLDIGLQLVT